MPSATANPTGLLLGVATWAQDKQHALCYALSVSAGDHIATTDTIETLFDWRRALLGALFKGVAIGGSVIAIALAIATILEPRLSVIRSLPAIFLWHVGVPLPESRLTGPREQF